MTNNHQQKPDIVDVAAQSLREIPVPDGPSPSLVASTLGALHSSTPLPEGIRLQERTARMFRIARYSGLTVATVAIAIILGWVAFVGNTGNVAFADVINKMKEAESVQLVLKHTLRKEDVLEISAHWWIQGNQSRMEYPKLLALVTDLKSKQSVQFDLVKKIALRLPAPEEASKQSNNVLYQLSHLQPEGAQRCANEAIDGRNTLVYQLDSLDNVKLLGLEGADAIMKLWVDPETKLPVKIVVDVIASGENVNKKWPFDTTLTFEKIEWNKKLDASLFSLEIPKDYTVQDGPERPNP